MIGEYLGQANGLTEEHLTAAKSLTGATMPDGRVLKGDRSPHGPTFNEWHQKPRGGWGEQRPLALAYQHGARGYPRTAVDHPTRVRD
jgi:hypothetical protein